MKETIKTEKSDTNNQISAAQVMEKIERAIASDKDLSAGHFREFQETTRADNSCSRTFRATIGVSVVIYNES
jgi:hypothetical protein